MINGLNETIDFENIQGNDILKATEIVLWDADIILKEVTNLLKYSDKIPLTMDAIPYNNYIGRDYDKSTGRGWKTLALKYYNVSNQL